MIHDCQHPDHVGDRRISDRKNVFKERRDWRSLDTKERLRSRETGVVWCRACVNREDWGTDRVSLFEAIP